MSTSTKKPHYKPILSSHSIAATGCTSQCSTGKSGRTSKTENSESAQKGNNLCASHKLGHNAALNVVLLAPAANVYSYPAYTCLQLPRRKSLKNLHCCICPSEKIWRFFFSSKRTRERYIINERKLVGKSPLLPQCLICCYVTGNRKRKTWSILRTKYENSCQECMLPSIRHCTKKGKEKPSPCSKIIPSSTKWKGWKLNTNSQGKQAGLTATKEAIKKLNRKRKYCLTCLIKIVLNGLYLQWQGIC